jgi:hypothetical protein
MLCFKIAKVYNCKSCFTNLFDIKKKKNYLLSQVSGPYRVSGIRLLD